MKPDPLWQQARQSGRLHGRPIQILERVPSTNTVAMEQGRTGAPAGTVVIAEYQDQGRGRLGKSWLSPRGCGLYFSLLLKPDLTPADLPGITLAAGVAVCRALEETTGTRPMIKWPNDILLDGRKSGGILAEAEIPAASDAFLVVLGIGLNVTTRKADFPPELRDKATSLLEHGGRVFLRSTLLEAILREIDEAVRLLEAGRFSDLLAEWRRRDATRDALLTWVNSRGELVTGISLGVDSEGQLKIRDQAGTVHTVLSGDIRLAGKGK